jgi:hypothetical protein
MLDHYTMSLTTIIVKFLKRQVLLLVELLLTADLWKR